MEKREKDLFRRIIENHLQFDDDFNPDHLDNPRTLLMTAIFKLKTIEDRQEHFLSLDRYNELAQEFQTILGELKVEVKKGNLFAKKKRKQNPPWVNPSTIDGAARADFRHRRLLGDDY